MQEIEDLPIEIDFWKNPRGFCEYENYYKSVENKLKTNPTFAFKYAEKYGRIEEYEDVFLLDAKQAFLYAFWIIKGRLEPKIEKTFLKNPGAALLYARHICQGKLPTKLENCFLLSAELAYEYSILTGNRLREKIENVFLKDEKYALLYSREVIKGKFSEKIHNALFLKYSFDESCEKIYLKEYFDENK